MDVQMPVMDGLQATRAIREFESTTASSSRVPIIAMTAFAGNEDCQICLDAGMDDYLSKPINLSRLLQILNKFCPRPDEAPESATDVTPETTPPKALASGDIPELAAFAQSELLERLGGRTEMIPRFVGLFCKGFLSELNELVTALAAEDSDSVRRHAHAIKGSAGNIAAMRLHNLAGLIEKAAKEGDLSEAQRKLAQLQQEYLAFNKAVSAFGITVTPQ
jgi:HPt (histidine-containing phosphotransfer) domain-containing protein